MELHSLKAQIVGAKRCFPENKTSVVKLINNSQRKQKRNYERVSDTDSC
jgi:hypothetical protein